MTYVVFILVRIVKVLLAGLELAMLFRAILSWFPLSDDNPIVSLLYCITEPFVMPVRALLEKLGWFQGSPFDMSFFFTYMIIFLISLFL